MNQFAADARLHESIAPHCLGRILVMAAQSWTPPLASLLLASVASEISRFYCPCFSNARHSNIPYSCYCLLGL